MSRLLCVIILVELLACSEKKQPLHKGESIIAGVKGHWEEFTQNDSFFRVTTIPGKGFYRQAAGDEKLFRDSTFIEKWFLKNGRMVQIKSFEGGVPHGEWKVWADDGQILSRTVINKGIAIDYESWHTNGSLRAKGKVQPDGTMIREEYYPGGVINQTFTVDSLGNGTFQGYFPNRQLKEKGRLISFEPIGIWIRLDSLGNKLSDTLYTFPTAKQP
ncbi:MAG TPA: hypothetical protein VI731_11125 [Bacteroidia bacterium]|nr:hypothetical protein [Bacteroidia bacterium]